MTALTWLAAHIGWLILAGIAALLVMALVLSPWLIRNWRITREMRALDDPLPGHEPGPLKASDRAVRQLHRDLVLLLVVNADREDAS